jgi:hypothetical protein
MVLVKPATVVQWHRQGFRLYWRWRSRPGRQPVNGETRKLIRQMCLANPRWCAADSPRVKVREATVAKYMLRRPYSPTSTWRSFLHNHALGVATIDMFIVPSATFRLLFVMLILAHDRRKIVGFDVTPHSTAGWLSRQVTEAFPWDTAPRFLLRDRDSSYGQVFSKRVDAMDITEVISAPRSPWQHPYVARAIGSIRRACLDHLIIFNERHLRRILSFYQEYYHRTRTHLSLGKDCPDPRSVQPPAPREGDRHSASRRFAPSLRTPGRLNESVPPKAFHEA